MNFHRNFIISIVILALMLSVTLAKAEDKILNTKIDSVVTTFDKNHNEYTRFIVTEPRTLSGVKYQKSLAVMAFGNLNEPAKSYQAGDQLKAVVNSKIYNGNESYTVLSFITE